MSNSPLATIQVPAHTNNYTRGRGGHKIDMVVMHHMAGKCTAYTCGTFFQNPNRKGSTHYGIGYDGEIAQYVDEANTAWANSNWNINQRAISFESANSERGGNWPVSDATIDSIVKLMVDISQRNQLGLYVYGVNFKHHRDCCNNSTACPGNYLISKSPEIVARANAILQGETISYDPALGKDWSKSIESTNKEIKKYSCRSKDFSTLSGVYDYVRLLKLNGQDVKDITYTIFYKTTTTKTIVTYENGQYKYEVKDPIIDESDNNSKEESIDQSQIENSPYFEDEGNLIPVTSLLLEDFIKTPQEETKEENTNE